MPVRALPLATEERHKKESVIMFSHNHAFCDWQVGVTSWECHELWCTFHYIIRSQVNTQSYKRKCKILKVVKQYWRDLGTTTVFWNIIMKYYLSKLWISNFLDSYKPIFPLTLPGYVLLLVPGGSCREHGVASNKAFTFESADLELPQ